MKYLIIYSLTIIIIFIDSCTQKKDYSPIIVKIDSTNARFWQIKEIAPYIAENNTRWVLSESKKIKYTKGVILGEIYLGVIFEQKGNYDSAIYYYLNALNARLKGKDSSDICNSYLSLLKIYVKLKNKTKQKYYLNKAKNSIGHNDTAAMITIKSEEALVDCSNDDYQSAKIKFAEALNLAHQFSNKNEIAVSIENMGNIYNQLEMDDSAMYYYKQCLPIYKTKNLNSNLAAIYNNIAYLFWAKNQRDSTRLYLEMGYEETKRFGNKEELEHYLTSIIDFWEEEPNLAKSNLYLHELVTLKDTVFNKNLATKLAGIEKSFEVKLQQEENAKLKAEVSRKNIIRNSAILLAILTIVLAVYRIRIYKQKQNLALQQQQLKENEIDQLLQERELKNMDALLEGRETERKRIGQDLHDRLGSILSTVKLHFSAIEDRIDNLKKDNQIQYQKASELLDEAVGEVRKISQDLVSGVLAKYGLVAALNDMKNSLEATGKIKINIFENGLEGRNNPEFEIGIYRIVQELMSNILKHSEAGKVDIHLTKDENEFTLIVEDNGKGFNPNQPEKFGLGMANIKQRVASLGGEVTFDSKPGNGATVIIEVPDLTQKLDS